MKTFFKIVITPLLFLLLIALIIWARLNSSNISRDIITFMEENRISFVWMNIILLIISGYLYKKNWDKIKNYDELDAIETMEITLIMISPFFAMFLLAISISHDFL